MKSKKIIRILSFIANALLLSVGCVVSVISPSVEDDGALISVFSIVMCGIMLIILIIECVTAFKIHDSSLHTAAIAAFLLLFMLFSPDMRLYYLTIGIEASKDLFDVLDYLFFICVGLSFAMFFRHTYRPYGKKMQIIPLFACGIICSTAYIALQPLNLQYIALFCFIAGLAGWYAFMRFFAYKCDLDNAPFYFSLGIYASAAGMQAVNTLFYSGLIAGCVGWSILYFWIILLCFSVIYLIYFLRNEGAALQLSEYQMQNENLKMKVLIGQIKPHFIFNALTTIKSGYHREIAEGDSALELFSEYMRKSLSLIDTEIIPFEQELQNVSSYINFINKSQSHPYIVLYNIDFTDFNVPAFSLQPFIENAVKYSKVNEKDDGFIMISTATEKKFIVIKISDNGVGFDTSKLKKGAHGINNSAERFKLLFDTEPVVSSMVSVGTEITITLKHTREENKS